MDAKKLETISRDAISFLPDEVLGNILSSLPTKEAASTSVLSRNWRDMYRLVDDLDFDDSVRRHAEAARQGLYVFPESFTNFVDRTLALQCNSPIKKLSLKCHVGEDEDREIACVDRWISNVVERGVIELDLRIKAGGEIFLPCQLFKSKTLVKLTLGTKLRLGMLPSDVSLPALKILFIDSIVFDDEELYDVLLSGCPVLEELSVHQEDVGTPDTISSLTVKRLLVDYSPSDMYHDGGYMSFDLPNLVYLDYSAYAQNTYIDGTLEALVEAKLDLHLTGRFWPDVTSLIMGIRNVEILHLSYFSLDVIYYSCCKKELDLPVFNNLVHLFLQYSDKRGWKLLAYLIKQSPKLETLTIEDVNSYAENVCMPPNQVKVLHILKYGGYAGDLEPLKSFLRGFEFLEVVQVDVTQKDDDKRLQATKDLKMLPGVSVSTMCHIKVTQVI